MPRFDLQRLTPRQAPDSSASADVHLPVQADLNAVRGQGSTMFALSRALNGLSGDVLDAGQRNALGKQRAQAQQAKLDGKEGAAKAAERDVTGVNPTAWLEQASDAARAGYEETDGINAVNRFEQSIQPALARLEPGADIDGFIEQHVEQFVHDTGMPEDTRKAFLVGLSKSQDAIKQGYLKQSIKESLDREEESLSSLMVDGLRKGDLLTPQGYGTWRTYAASKGLHEDEIDTLAVKAVKASLASGDIDLGKGMALLQTATAPGRPVLADVPEHAEELQFAAKRGQAVQDDRAKQARYDSEVRDTVQIDALADQGILGNARALAWGKANDKTAAEVAAKLNQSREARERLSAKNQQAEKDRLADLAWRNHDPLRENAVGIAPAEVAKAGDRAFTQALQSGDDAAVQAVLEHSARQNAPIPALKGILASIDENNPAQATRYAGIYERMQHISPAWAARQVDDKTLARMTQYQTAKMLGASDAQAWSQVKMGSQLDPAETAKNVAAAMKMVDKEAPKDFPSEHFWQSNTPIANLSEMDTAYRLSVRSMVEAGASPEVAAQAALTRVQSSYIRVGDRMVRSYGTGDGMEKQTGEAMTEASRMFKDQLVKQNVVGADDPVWFVPVPGADNTWRLKYFAAGGVPLDVTREVTRQGADGRTHTATEFIDVIPSATRANYAVWKQQEEARDVRNAQAFKQFGVESIDMSPESVTAFNAKYASLLHPKEPWQAPSDRGPIDAAFERSQHDQLVTRIRIVSEYVNTPAHQRESFADFIASQH